MARVQACLFLFSAIICGLSAVPVVIKESTPNGEAVIAISSSNPEVEKHLLDYAEKNNYRTAPAVEGRSHGSGSVVQSFSISGPDRVIAGTGRSFGDDSFTNPFFVPYLSSDIAGFDINGWLKNLDKLYDPSFPGSSVSASATAINDNGHVYGKVQTVNDGRGHN